MKNDDIILKIREYWLERGYTISIHVAMDGNRSHGAYPVTRSDLTNGLPWNYKSGPLAIAVNPRRE